MAADRQFHAASTWRVYCGAHTHVSLVSDGDQGECGTEFVYADDDPDRPSAWVPCPKCGGDCEVLRTSETAVSSAANVRHVHRWRVQSGGSAITNSEAGMMFKVCPCGAVEPISYAEAQSAASVPQGVARMNPAWPEGKVPSRVIACPLCGAPLPPDTSLLGHKCGGKR